MCSLNFRLLDKPAENRTWKLEIYAQDLLRHPKSGDQCFLYSMHTEHLTDSALKPNPLVLSFFTEH